MFTLSNAVLAIIFPGAPIRDKFPPNAAAKTKGINSFERAKPDFAATPTTTGINTAAVPVFDKTPDNIPTITIIAIINCFSVLANFVITPPMSLAIPVSNKAPPTINIATKRITLPLTKPSNASFIVKTPVKFKPTQTIIDVSANGIFSVTYKIIVKAKNKSVIVTSFI